MRDQTSSVLPSTRATNWPISSAGAPRGACCACRGALTCCATLRAVPGSKPRKYAMTATTIPPTPRPPPTMPMPRRSSTLPLARWFPSSMRPGRASAVPLSRWRVGKGPTESAARAVGRDTSEQLVRMEGLRQMVVEARAKRALAIGRRGVRRHGDEKRRRSEKLAQLRRHLVAITARHADIEQVHVRLDLPRGPDNLLRVRERDNVEAFRFEQHAERDELIDVVVRYQDTAGRSAHRRRTLARSRAPFNRARLRIN